MRSRSLSSSNYVQPAETLSALSSSPINNKNTRNARHLQAAKLLPGVPLVAAHLLAAARPTVLPQYC